jgi:hypothetical protein
LRLLSRAAKIRLSLFSQSMKFIRHSLSLQSLLNFMMLARFEIGRDRSDLSVHRKDTAPLRTPERYRQRCANGHAL